MLKLLFGAESLPDSPLPRKRNDKCGPDCEVPVRTRTPVKSGAKLNRSVMQPVGRSKGLRHCGVSEGLDAETPKGGPACEHSSTQSSQIVESTKDPMVKSDKVAAITPAQLRLWRSARERKVSHEQDVAVEQGSPRPSFPAHPADVMSAEDVVPEGDGIGDSLPVEMRAMSKRPRMRSRAFTEPVEPIVDAVLPALPHMRMRSRAFTEPIKPIVDAFCDQDFPATASSIGLETHLHVKWRRVKDLNLGSTQQKKPELFGKIGADNFTQGELGNCWLLAAMASLADFPGHIMDLFSPREYSPQGRYEVRLYDIQHGWCSVVIDDRIPCCEGTDVPCFCVAKNGVFWPLLLEKACAKFCGSYAHLDGGSQAWAYQVLAGVTQQKSYEKENRVLFGSCWQEYPTSVLWQSLLPANWRTTGMKHTPKTLASRFGSTMGVTPHFSAQRFFKQLAYYEQCGFLISASIEGPDNPTEEQLIRSDGLFIDHAYAILKIQKVHETRMVKLRNPWEGFEWHGRFSRTSQAWRENSQLARDLWPDLGEELTGEFWMAWEDFESIFTDINVSPGCLPVPRQPPDYPEFNGAMPRCGRCRQTGDRWWCMADFDAADDGEWVRLKPGDFCLSCRRAHRGGFKLENSIAGVDAFLLHPQPKLPCPPRDKPVCKCGPDCRERCPEHFATFSHPWLNLKF